MKMLGSPNSEELREVEFTIKGRKANPDITLSFSDNAKGMASGIEPESAYSYGFDIYTYFGDLIENEDGVIANRPDDNVRIKIIERFNMAANVNVYLEAAESPHAKLLDVVNEDDTTVQSLLEGTLGVGRQMLESKIDVGNTMVAGSVEYDVLDPLKYEFIAADNTLDVVGEEFLSDYPAFMNSFQTKATYEPPTILLSELIKKENGDGPSLAAAKTFRSEFIENTLDTFFKTVADINAKEKSGWAYGASFDTLSPKDFTYGIADPNDPTNFVPYHQAKQVFFGEEYGYTEKDMVLGISLNQHNTFLAGGTMDDVRVIYLDPATFGGRYLRPAFHVRPQQPEGVAWINRCILP